MLFAGLVLREFVIAATSWFIGVSTFVVGQKVLKKSPVTEDEVEDKSFTKAKNLANK
jgi:hypothetical protein